MNTYDKNIDIFTSSLLHYQGKELIFFSDLTLTLYEKIQNGQLKDLPPYISKMFPKMEYYFLKKREILLWFYSLLDKNISTMEINETSHFLKNYIDITNTETETLIENPVKINLINDKLYQITMPSLLIKNKNRQGSECKYLQKSLLNEMLTLKKTLPFFEKKAVIFTHILTEKTSKLNLDIDNSYTSFILNEIPGPDATPYVSLHYETKKGHENNTIITVMEKSYYPFFLKNKHEILEK